MLGGLDVRSTVSGKVFRPFSQQISMILDLDTLHLGSIIPMSFNSNSNSLSLTLSSDDHKILNPSSKSSSSTRLHEPCCFPVLQLVNLSEKEPRYPHIAIPFLPSFLPSFFPFDFKILATQFSFCSLLLQPFIFHTTCYPTSLLNISNRQFLPALSNAYFCRQPALGDWILVLLGN